MRGVGMTVILALTMGVAARGETVNVRELVGPLRAVESKGAGNEAAGAAWRRLSQAEPAQLPEILAAMDGANPLAHNWLRSAADAVAARALAAGGRLPVAELEKFLADRKHSPRGRRTAYELIQRVDPQAETRLIPPLLDDPSMELRYDAVRLAMDAAAKLEADQPEQARTAYGRAFAAARDYQQVKDLAAKLESLGGKPDLSRHYGFVMRWKLVAPFDNVDQKGFDIPYGPETNPQQATFTGKEGEVKWVEHTTEDPYGLVDLNKALAKHKGAICYALAEFIATEERGCELRLGCINANKVWLNGELLISNQVYHAGTQVDQYRGVGRLRRGSNQILVKIAQNEQTEQWAQDWAFQLRVCDELGTAILDANRAGNEAARAAGPPTGAVAGR